MKLKNRYGQTETLQELWWMVSDPIERGMYDDSADGWLDSKAYCAYLERYELAEAAGASAEELDAINAQDVQYTLWDEIQRRWLNTLMGAFIAALYHFYTDEPDYTGLIPQ